MALFPKYSISRWDKFPISEGNSPENWLFVNCDTLTPVTELLKVQNIVNNYEVNHELNDGYDYKFHDTIN